MSATTKSTSTKSATNKSTKSTTPTKSIRSAKSVRKSQLVISPSTTFGGENVPYSESVVTLYTAPPQQFDSSDEENKHLRVPVDPVPGFDKPTSSTHQIIEILEDTRYLFIRRILHPKRGNTSPSVVRSPHDDAEMEYAIENIHMDTILIARKLKIEGLQRKERLSIAYHVVDGTGHLVFSVFGNAGCCGTSVLLQGLHEIVRGKLSSTQWSTNYALKDYLTGRYYEIIVPWWVNSFSCFLLFFDPVLQLKEALASRENVGGRRMTILEAEDTIAVVSKRKWKGTMYENEMHFGLHFVSDIDADTKFFLTGASLIIFHIFFRSSERSYFSLLVFALIFLIFILVLVIIAYLR